MFLLILRFITFSVCQLYVSAAMATMTIPRSPSIGEFAGSLMEPVTILSKFISTASMMLGIMCLFSAFLRYMQYRVNRVASPLSTVIVLSILGLLLLALPFVHVLTGYNPFPKS